MLKAKTDFKCKLINPDGSEALFFNASSVGDLIENASFVGGGIANGGQNITIWTEQEFEYKPYHHNVVINGWGKGSYKLTSVQKGVRKRLGAQSMKPKAVYILYLE